MSKLQVVVVFPTYKEHNQKYIALGHVTVFKGPFKKIKTPFLNGIGGHIENGETPEEAARREFDEEVLVSTTKLPTEKLVYIGVVDILFRPGRKEVQLHVFRKYFPEKVTITPKGTGDFESFDWYPLQNISCPRIGPNGAEILPSDRFWLPAFFVSKGFHRAKIEITNQFQVYETGKGNSYRSGEMILFPPVHPST